MKKLDLDFAGWLWAIGHNKEKEYYREYYNDYIDFTPEIGGSIVSQFLLAEPTLLAIAYRHLSWDWNINLWSTFPETFKPYSCEAEMKMNMQTISWLLFHTLAHNIEMKTIKELIEGDYETLWKQLTEKYPDEPTTREEKE